MTIEEILNTDHLTALPEGVWTEEELNCQQSNEEIERLPNISTLLRASEFIDLGIINYQATAVTATVQTTSVTATVQANSVTETVQAMPATAMPGTTIPATATVQSEENSTNDLPISKYLQKFLQQKDFPQQDLTETQQVTEFSQQEDVMETEHVTEFPQQVTETQQHVTEEVSEPHQLPPKKRPISQEQAIPQQEQEPPKIKSKIVIKHIPVNP